jgi:MtN3 and saliva related transmembrane protein
MSAFVPLAGWAAGILTLAAGLPQAFKLLRTRNTEGVASWTYVLWTLVAIWWTGWGLAVHAWPTFVINALCIPILGLSAVLLGPSRVQYGLLIASVPACIVLSIVSPFSVLLVASGLLLAFSVPSAVVALKAGSDLSGVAVGTWALVVLNNILWLVFDIGIHQPFAGVAGMITATLAAIVIARTLEHRKGIAAAGEVEAAQG